MFPHVWHPLRCTITPATQYMVLAVSIERYVVICYKMDGSVKAHSYTGAVIAFSLLVNMPKFFEFQIYHHQVQKQNNSTAENNQSNASHLSPSTTTEVADEETEISYYTSKLGEDSYYVLFNAYHEIFVTGFCLLAICFCNIQVYFQIEKSSLIKDR